MFLIDRVKDLQSRHARTLPILFFVGGFLWDALTIKRIDSWVDHLFMASYLAGLSLSLWVSYSKPKPKKKHLRNIVALSPLFLQFFLGGLFSAYVVLFFKSASLISTYLYLGLLVVFLFGNEWIKYEKSSTSLVSIVYTLAIFSYLCFTIPVLVRSINVWTFILSIVLTALAAIIFWSLLLHRDHIDLLASSKSIAVSIVTLALVTLGYFGNFIPPVPVSLKSGGLYLKAERSANDEFQMVYEKARWTLPWEKYNKSISYKVGEPLYCFAAVFAPIKLETALVHKWQKLRPGTKVWETTDELDYKIIGGRDGGFRGITYKQNISPGEWRVDILTENGKIVGRLPFKIVEQEVNNERLVTIYQ